MLCKTFCNVNESLDITRADKQGDVWFLKSLTTETRQATKTTEKTIVDKHSLEYTEVPIVSAMRKGFLLCSQVWHSLIFCQSRFSEQRTKTRSRAVWSCFYHEVSKMWVMWNPTICIHNVSRPETDMITVGADIDECFIFFKIIYISFWKK